VTGHCCRLAAALALFIVLVVAACNEDSPRQSVTTPREPVSQTVDREEGLADGEAFVRRMVREQGGKRVNISCSYLSEDELRCTGEWTGGDESQCGADFTLRLADGQVSLASGYAITSCVSESIS
jgi:hypothetical protein